MDNPNLISTQRITIGMRSVAIGDLNDGIPIFFTKNEGTAVITTEIKLSNDIARALAQLLNDKFGEESKKAEQDRFLEIVDRCKKENPDVFDMIKPFGENAISRATLFSALADFAVKIKKLENVKKSKSKKA